MKKFSLLLCLLALFVVSCQTASTDSDETAPDISAATADDESGATDNVTAADDDDSSVETAAEPTSEGSEVEPTNAPVPVGRIDDELAVSLLYDLTSPDGAAAFDAADYIRESGDDRFVAAFIEMMRASQIGISFVNMDYWVSNAERLSGQEFGGNWAEWIDWYGGTDLEAPPGFTGWKGQLLANIDPEFGDFLQEDLQSAIRVEEIQWGGVVVDGIPALDHSPQIDPADADYLEADEPVFGIAINGEAHAYPLRIIDWHEMANDTVGGVPVSLAYCTLCGAAIAYHGTASDGVTYDFGSSGFLYRSNKLMYDRQTRTLWNQLTGEPVLGSLVGTGVKMELLPVVLTSWSSWQEQHPETLVLDIDTGFNRRYDIGSAYGSYFASNDTMFPVWQRSSLLENKEQVYTLTINGEPKAYPISILTEEQVVNDTLAGVELLLVAQRGVVDVEGLDQRWGPVEYSAGAEVRAFERSGHTFSPGAETDQVVDENGTIWTVTEEALVSEEGEELARINGHLAYWFGWFAFFPNTLLYGSEAGG